MRSACLLALCCVAIAAAETGSTTDPNLRFIGRWDRTDPALAKGQWAGAYIRLAFTGTSVRVMVGEKANLRASIDGGTLQDFNGGPGLIDLAPTPLATGEHHLLVMPQKETDSFVFQAFELDPGAKTMPVRERPIIEFIGDSITVSSTEKEWKDSRLCFAYAWQTAALLDADAVFIAKSGAPMVGDDKPGMGVEFAKDKGYRIDGSAVWKPTYTPALVVVNLGANDIRWGFVQAGVAMIKQLRAWHPKVQVVCLRPFGGQASEAPPQIVAALEREGMSGIHHVDTTGWLEKGDYMDGVHTSPAGSRKAAEKLAPILRKLLPKPSTKK
jgi:lysophospholipase L1-like esterase